MDRGLPEFFRALSFFLPTGLCAGRKSWRRLVAGLTIGAAGTAVAFEPGPLPPDAPNIVVIYTDDQGYADLGVHDIRDDIRTPHIDRLAEEGVLFTHGYVSAPVCGPSRGGLLSGQYQQRMGVETNAELPFELVTTPFPERLREAGYRTGMAGKLHLPVKERGMGEDPRDWGFEEFFMRAGDFVNKPRHRFLTHDLEGNPLPKPAWREIEGYRTDLTFEFGVDFIERNRDRPFFLYVAPLAPHTPLEATEAYLARFPGVEPPARHYALAMMAAIDDGVGELRSTLDRLGLADNTLVFFISDNGAPLKGKRELPVEKLKYHEWNGSLNEPLRGEKGMLSEGGIRVPFLMAWPGRVPGDQVIDEPVINLDVAATALAAAGQSREELDGVDLLPLVTGEEYHLDRNLYWTFGGQTAIRSGPWKLLQSDYHGPYLFDVTRPVSETRNRIDDFPELADRLRADLDAWIEEIGFRAPPRQPLINLQKGLYQRHYGDVE
jgi:arylsulfatase A-like enzyme